MSPWNPRQWSGKPIPVADGLVTSHSRGAMADTWWSKRFIDALESFGLGGRMDRGKNYARRGQVISLDVVAGLLMAQVQGSRPAPYVVTVKLDRATDAQWAHVEQAMQQRVGLVARLLAGEVPDDLEDAFAAAGVRLFPATWDDVDAACSCPDFGNPCKHIAAVLYLFADRLDTDPWLLLAWRGRTRDALLAHLDRHRGSASASDDSAAGRAAAVAPWWPLVPGNVSAAGAGGLGLGLGVGALVADVPADADRVLARLEPLKVDTSSVPIEVRLAEAYRSVVSGDGG